MYALNHICNRCLGRPLMEHLQLPPDVAANGFWGGRHEKAFFDIRVFNPHAQSNSQPIASCYRKHENLKKRAYDQRVREIEHGTFTPLVLSLTGGMGGSNSVL